MNVLSFFDGMSCGQIALNRAGIKYKKYFAAEIDKHAIKITQKNYPHTIQLGDVEKIDLNILPKIDLFIGGSPCQGFSFAGKQLNFNDPRSRLFFDFVNAYYELKKKNSEILFLLENVKMKKEYQDVISRLLGVEPIEINSALVSAQNRKRLYWTNIPGVCQPTDKGILLKDILLNDGLPINFTERRTEKAKQIRKESLKNGRDFCPHRAKELVPRTDSKSNCITANIGKDAKSSPVVANFFKGVPYNVLKANGLIRKFHPVECERLQTVPDNYTEGVSNTQRYKMLGNGWTVDVITHIFFTLKDKK